MSDFKSLLASKTFWGSIIALGSIVAGMFGYTIGAEDQVSIVDAVASIGGVIGVFVAVYGRVVATKQIG